jgi:hypothetical protein
MDWLFQSPPAPWQWVGIIIGILAFVGFIVSLPTILQMFCGQPNIKIKLRSRDVYEGRVLECQLVNPPITKHLLKRLGVHRRTIDDLVAVFTIEDVRGRIVGSTVIADINTARNTPHNTK